MDPTYIFGYSQLGTLCSIMKVGARVIAGFSYLFGVYGAMFNGTLLGFERSSFRAFGYCYRCNILLARLFFAEIGMLDYTIGAAMLASIILMYFI